MRTPVYTKKFEKDLKLCKKRNYDLNLLKDVMRKLINNEALAENNRPHLLLGNYNGFWECHIKPDWLLIYQFSEEITENSKKNRVCYFCQNWYALRFVLI